MRRGLAVTLDGPTLQIELGAALQSCDYVFPLFQSGNDLKYSSILSSPLQQIDHLYPVPLIENAVTSGHTDHQSANVIVVGAGVFGAAMAVTLAR